jgi:hypothetical protein
VLLRLVCAVKKSLTPFLARLRGQEGSLSPGLASDKSLTESVTALKPQSAYLASYDPVRLLIGQSSVDQARRRGTPTVTDIRADAHWHDNDGHERPGIARNDQSTDRQIPGTNRELTTISDQAVP